MNRIKTIKIPLPLLGTVFFTFLLCCSTMAMETETPNNENEPGERKKHVRTSPAHAHLNTTSPFSSPKPNADSKSPLPSLRKTSPSPSSKESSQKNSGSKLQLSHRISFSNPTSPLSLPKVTLGSGIPRRERSASNLPSSPTSLETNSLKLTSRRASASNMVDFSNAKDSDSQTSDEKTKLPLRKKTASCPNLNTSPEMPSLSPSPRTLNLNSPSSSPRSSNDKRLSYAKRLNLLPSQLSLHNEHASSSGRTIYAPRYFQNFADILVDVLDNVMCKPSVFGCMEDLQHLRWNFYHFIKRHKLAFDFKLNENIDDIKYIDDIDHKYKNLLDRFWDANVKKYLDNKELFSNIEVNDLELMGKSIEFLIYNPHIRADKSFLYKYAFLCYQNLYKNPDVKNKEKYHYKLAKYATLTENYEKGYSHFLECIKSDYLHLEKDFRWVSLIKNKFLSKIKSDKIQTISDNAEDYFQIATLTDLMNNIIIKASKPRFMHHPPTLEDKINPDEVVFFYDKLFYCKFFDKPKMELDMEAVHFLLENERMLREKTGPGRLCSLELENKDKNFKIADFMDYISKRVKGITPIFMDSPPTSEYMKIMKPGNLILFYEDVPFCQVLGKERKQIRFDNTSESKKVCFDELIKTLVSGINIQKNLNFKEIWNQLKKYVSSDAYNCVLNMHKDQNREPDSKVTDLFLKSATLYYQGKNPWKTMKEWKPNILFYVAQAALRDIQEKRAPNAEFLENFYYDLMEFFIDTNKDNFNYHTEYYKSILKKSIDFPASINSSNLLIKRGKYFAKMGKIASDLGEYDIAEKLYAEASALFYIQKCPISFYKKPNDNHHDFVIGDDMIAIVIAHAFQRKTRMEERDFIKDLSFHLARERKYEQEKSKIGKEINIYDLIFTYFYNTKMYVTCQNFIDCLPREYCSLKESWTPYLEDLSLNYKDIQENKKIFFNRFSDIMLKIMDVQEKPNEQKMTLLQQDVSKSPLILTEGQWAELKKISGEQIKNFYSYLKSFGGIGSDTYKNEEYEKYKEKIFEMFGIKDL